MTNKKAAHRAAFLCLGFAARDALSHSRVHVLHIVVLF